MRSLKYNVNFLLLILHKLWPQMYGLNLCKAQNKNFLLSCVVTVMTKDLILITAMQKKTWLFKL